MDREDLERRDEVRQGNALVALPLLVVRLVINEDEEGFVIALEADLVNDSLAASHLVCRVLREVVLSGGCLLLDRKSDCRCRLV